MSIHRHELVKYLEENAFRIIREGGNHTIYSNGLKVVPVTGSSTASLRTKSASKQVWNQNFSFFLRFLTARAEACYGFSKD